jgi:hypothetical protein
MELYPAAVSESPGIKRGDSVQYAASLYAKWDFWKG